MSLEETRELNRQRNAEIFASFDITKSQDHLWKLKKKTTPKRLSAPFQKPQPRLPKRRSLRLQTMPVLADITPEVEEVEDRRKPAGTFDVGDSLRDAGTDPLMKRELKKMVSRSKTFDSASLSSASLSDFVSNLKSLKMTPKTVEKVVVRRANTLVFHPMVDKAVVVMGDVAGNLGFWNIFEQRTPVVLSQPHSSCITEVNVHCQNPNWVVTSSYDGSVRITDMAELKVLEPFRSENEIPVISFDFVTPQILIKGQFNSKASVLDLREDNKTQSKSFTCADRRASVKSISVHPTQTKVFSASTNDGTVLLWDRRNPKAPLEKLDHFRTVQWCRFSPCSGCRLLTSSSSNEIRIYDTKVLGQGSVRLERIIQHDNRTGRFVAPFRPTWVPQREDSFLIGSMKFPREMEVYNVDSGLRAASIQHELLSSINSQVAYHPTHNILVGGNSSGRAHAFIP